MTGATTPAGVHSTIEPLAVAGWAELPWLVHGFSTRSGGSSTVYGTAGGDLNLGFTAHDDPKTVGANRELLLDHLLGSSIKSSGSRGGEHVVPASSPLPSLVTLRQTHSAIIHRVDATHALAPSERATLEGDGLMTNTPGVLLGMQTADCVPVLVVDPQRRAVAAFHAGWRGTLAGIVEEGVRRMAEEFGSRPVDLLAAVGPAIGPCCYEVGEELLEKFASRFDYVEELFRRKEPAAAEDSSELPSAGLHLDLAEANRLQLLATGLSPESINMTGTCTSCQIARFFSHRAEHGFTGRMLAVIGIRNG